jgi:uncharacterized protein
MKNNYFHRKIYKELKDHLQNNDVTILTGMRRTGKTTLVQHLLEDIHSNNKIFLDLEKISNREMFLDKNYDNVILTLEKQGLDKSQRMYIAIDEIQTLPNISSVVKYLNDHYDIKFILTGSSSYYLKNLFTESLSGRKKLFELYPLDFGEFLIFKNIAHKTLEKLENLQKFNNNEYERLKAHYEEYVEYGGFPKVVLAASIKEKKDILEDIMSSYVNIDIKSISDFKDSDSIINLIKMLVSRIGTKLDYAKLSRLTGLSRATVQNYISLFEKTYLISLVSVHTQNRDREIVKAKKIYFGDNGSASVLGDIDSGAKFENALYNQLRHKADVKYFSLKDGREIDFVLDGEMALEAKETPIESDVASLGGLADKASVNNKGILGRHKAPNFADYIWGGDIL